MRKVSYCCSDYSQRPPVGGQLRVELIEFFFPQGPSRVSQSLEMGRKPVLGGDQSSG